MSLLQVENLSGGYEPVQIFSNVSMTVDEGGCVGFFGPNGHGKTTLMKTLSGLIDPWDGKIIFDGKQLNRAGERKSRRSRNLNYDILTRRRMNPKKVAQAGLIHVPQGSTLFPDMTIGEILSIAPLAAKMSGEVIDLEEVFALFPRLRERIKSKARFLSGGERQMLAMACGMLAAPKLLILDEPTLGLSPKVRLELSDCVYAIRNTGVPIILVEQDVEFLRDLVGSLNIFDHGSISRRLPQSEIPDHETLMTELFGERAD